MRNIKNLYLSSTLSALIGIVVLVLALYILREKFDILSIIIIGIIIWFGTFFSYKFLKKK